MFNTRSSLVIVLLATACGGADPTTTGEESAATIGARQPDLIECRTDEPCPRGSYCEQGLNICFTPSRCIVDGRPSDAFCHRTYGEDSTCLEYAPGSFHCVPTAAQPEPPQCRGLVECRTDRACPRGSACEPSINACLTPSRCIVDGRPSNELCQRTYGANFLCTEYAADSWHCAPYDLGVCE